ncbi:MAG: hypothetical protein JWN17_1027 [Frankiales bacterium]|nr:hypothetical protein [Frankiales bacterium]
MSLSLESPDRALTPDPPDRRRRRLLALLVAAAVLAAAVVTVLALRPPTWASGVSGGTTDAGFAAWRGSDLDVAGTYIDDDKSQLGVWPLLPGGDYDRWTGDLDLAVGAIGWDESWDAAAQGAYDDRWRASLQKIEKLWDRRDRGQLYLRFAHEMNGTWYPWNVTPEKTAAFKTAWKRYRALQQEVVPEAKLVFSVNRETLSGIDWRTAFPGRSQVDVVSVDYYDQDPHVTTAAQWTAEAHATDRWGGPKGLLAHQAFAKSVGLPFAVSEWGNDATLGEAPLFVTRMHRFFARNAGDGPGELLYEVYFNPKGADGGKWALWPETRQPATARAYRAAF